MTTILNEINYDLVKLNYILFNKFNQRVYYKVVRAQKVDDKLFSWSVIRSGYIHPDATKELIEHDFGAEELNSATTYKKNDKEKLSLLFDVCITRNQDNDYNIINKVKAVEDRRIPITGSPNQPDQIITTTTLITSKNQTVSFDDSNELYFVIIYPNSIRPALIRAYNKSTFSVLNLDDKNAIYNSYYSKNNMSKSVKIESESRANYDDVDIMMMENDKSIASRLKALSKETFNPENEEYHNIDLNLTVDEHEDIIINGVNLTKDARNFDFINFDEIKNIERKKNLCELIYEIVGAEKQLNLKASDEINGTAILKYSDNDNNLTFAITKSNYALIVTEYDESVVIHAIKIMLIDISNQTILTEFTDNETSMEFSSVNINYVYNKQPFNCVSKLQNPIYRINNIHKLFYEAIEELPKCYFENGIQVFDNNNDKINIARSPINQLITGEDDNGKYLLVRGVYGNLMKLHYED